MMKHGHCWRGGATPTYRSWHSMRARCQTVTMTGFENYGGRGIRFCARWNDFNNFLADMGERPPGTTLDRIDVNGDYEPGNCRWATKRQQESNKRRRKDAIVVDGKTLTEWSRLLGLHYKTVKQRYQKPGAFMNRLVVCCWKWVGWRGEMYNSHHVNVLEQMVKENLKLPHEFVCVTDNPIGVRCKTIPIWNDPEVMVQGKRPNCYRRLKVFSPDAKAIFDSHRILSIDLDCVILGNIDHMVTQDPFKAMQGKASPLNGSMFLHTLGTRTAVWNSFGCNAQDLVRRKEMRTKVRLYGSDQAWMSYCMPDAPVWTAQDGAYHYTLLKDEVPDDARICFFAGGLKPWNPDIAKRTPRAYETYRRYSQQVMGVN